VGNAVKDDRLVAPDRTEAGGDSLIHNFKGQARDEERRDIAGGVGARDASVTRLIAGKRRKI
jgi:hypothetical protein